VSERGKSLHVHALVELQHGGLCLCGVPPGVLRQPLRGLARDAHALGPGDIELGAKVGYATNPLSGSGASNPLFGLGGRAGFAFKGGLYLGGSVVD